MAQTHDQSPHWADSLAVAILEWQKKNNIQKLHVDDMKTPSGRVHVGALRGVVLHDIVAKVLAQHTTQKVVSTYVFNDMDSVDKIPHYLPQEKFTPWIGKPLHKTPAPSLEESGIDFSHLSEDEKERYRTAPSYGAFYAYDFIDAFRYLGCSQEIVWSHELYESGKMDATIRESLDKVDLIKKIYKDVAEYQLPQEWYPFRPFDLRPEVVSTTTTTWDGETVTYTSKDSEKNIVDSDTVSPFGGTGKLLWKIDWPSHWKTMGVTIEGAGKDHTSAGGSRDMAKAFCRDVFGIPEPFDIPYEWIMIRGAKMSSSKGVGTSAREFVALFPASVGRFLFVSKHYNQVIDFDPATMAIPDLYDEYDQGARIFWKVEEGDARAGRAFELAQVAEVPAPHFLPRFRDVAIWMQHPEIDMVQAFAEVKGSALTPYELAVLEERKKHAQIWIDTYAPSEFQLTPKTHLVLDSSEFSADEVSFLQTVFSLATSKTWPDPQELQQAIFEQAKTTIGAKTGFQALYKALLGKTHGPKAAWLLLSTSQEILENRIQQLESLEKS